MKVTGPVRHTAALIGLRPITMAESGLKATGKVSTDECATNTLGIKNMSATSITIMTGIE